MKINMFAGLLLAPVLGIGLVAGCSDAAGPGIVEVPGYTASTSLSLEEYCEKRAAIQGPWCSYYSRCCVDREQMLYTMNACDANYATPEACMESTKSFLAESGTTYAGVYAQASLDELALLVPEAPSTCSGTHLAELIQASDAHQGERLDGFRATFQGHLAEGAVCEYSASCAFGLTCQQSAGGTTFTCRQRSVGCSASSDCPSGKVCNDKYCAEPPKEGSFCKYRSDCDYGSVCWWGGCSATHGYVGDSCKSGEDCRVGTGCSLDKKCVALKSNGATCSVDGECNGYCKSGVCKGRCGGTGSY